MFINNLTNYVYKGHRFRGWVKGFVTLKAHYLRQKESNQWQKGNKKFYNKELIF